MNHHDDYGPLNNWECTALTLLAVAWFGPFFVTWIAPWFWHLNGAALLIGGMGIAIRYPH